MPRIHLTLDEDVYSLLERSTQGRRGMSAFLRRAIIETATRDAVRVELDVFREELHEARREVHERLDRIEQLLGIGVETDKT